MEALILTKSRMKSHGVSGVCTIAYDFQAETIVRFVSNLEGAPIGFPFNRRYECLDVVEVKTIRYCPIGPQTENVLVDARTFRRIGRYNGNLPELFEYISKQQGKPQYMKDVPYVLSYKLQAVDDLLHSLEIVKASDLILKRSKHGATKAFFWANTRNRKYNFKFKYYSVTDSKYELNDCNNSERRIGDAYILVSIPYTPFEKDGCFYKFIAAIYPIDE